LPKGLCEPIGKDESTRGETLLGGEGEDPVQG